MNIYLILFVLLLCGCNNSLKTCNNAKKLRCVGERRAQNCYQINEDVRIVIHKVCIGEDILVIAHKYNISVYDIIFDNQLIYPYIVRPGDKIKIIKKFNKDVLDKTNKLEYIEIDADEKVAYPWNIDNVNAEVILNFGENMTKLSLFLKKKFLDFDLDKKSDAIFIKLTSKDGKNLDIPIFSTVSGKVLAVESTDLGKIVVIDGGNGICVVYGHLSQIRVQKNKFVNLGDQIGVVNDNVCFKSCILSIGVYKMNDSQKSYVDPMKSLKYLKEVL